MVRSGPSVVKILSLSLTLEELNLAFVFFCFLSRVKGSEVFALLVLNQPCASTIDTYRFQFPDHFVSSFLITLFGVFVQLMFS